jgi:hypothetical protein
MTVAFEVQRMRLWFGETPPIVMKLLVLGFSAWHCFLSGGMSGFSFVAGMIRLLRDRRCNAVLVSSGLLARPSIRHNGTEGSPHYFASLLLREELLVPLDRELAHAAQ